MAMFAGVGAGVMRSDGDAWCNWLRGASLVQSWESLSFSRFCLAGMALAGWIDLGDQSSDLTRPACANLIALRDLAQLDQPARPANRPGPIELAATPWPDRRGPFKPAAPPWPARPDRIALAASPLLALPRPQNAQKGGLTRLHEVKPHLHVTGGVV